jgi:hypothetical protein
MYTNCGTYNTRSTYIYFARKFVQYILPDPAVHLRDSLLASLQRVLLSIIQASLTININNIRITTNNPPIRFLKNLK